MLIFTILAGFGMVLTIADDLIYHHNHSRNTMNPINYLEKAGNYFIRGN